MGLHAPVPNVPMVVEGHFLERVRLHVLRLYGEARWEPDEMRESAKQLECIIEDAFPLYDPD